MPRLAVLALLCTFALPVTGRAQTATFDPTGTWSGSVSCKALDGGIATKTSFKTATMRISAFGLNFAGVTIDLASDGQTVLGYNGPIAEVTARPGTGAATFTRCGTTSDSVNHTGEILSATKITIAPSAKAPASAKFVGTSAFQDGAALGGTCKYKFTRMSTDNPNVSGCAPTCLPPPG